MIVHTMPVEAGAILLSAETRLTAESVNAEVVASTSRTVAVVASEATAAETNSAVLGLDVEV